MFLLSIFLIILIWINKGGIFKLNNVVFIDIEQLAKDNNVPRSANMILLGAAQKSLGIGYEEIKAALGRVFARKGEEVVNANIKALNIGISESK